MSWDMKQGRSFCVVPMDKRQKGCGEGRYCLKEVLIRKVNVSCKFSWFCCSLESRGKLYARLYFIFEIGSHVYSRLALNHYVTKDDLELLIFLLPPLKC